MNNFKQSIKKLTDTVLKRIIFLLLLLSSTIYWIKIHFGNDWKNLPFFSFSIIGIAVIGYIFNQLPENTTEDEDSDIAQLSDIRAKLVYFKNYFIFKILLSKHFLFIGYFTLIILSTTLNTIYVSNIEDINTYNVVIDKKETRIDSSLVNKTKNYKKHLLLNPFGSKMKIKISPYPYHEFKFTFFNKVEKIEVPTDLNKEKVFITILSEELHPYLNFIDVVIKNDTNIIYSKKIEGKGSFFLTSLPDTTGLNYQLGKILKKEFKNNSTTNAIECWNQTGVINSKFKLNKGDTLLFESRFLNGELAFKQKAILDNNPYQYIIINLKE